MKKTNEDIATPLVLLIVYAMFSIHETLTLPESISRHNTSLFYEPLLFSENIFLTLSNFVWFAVPVVLVCFSFKEKDIFLSFLYMIGTVPFLLTQQVIMCLDIKILYLVKIIVSYFLTACLFRHITKMFEKNKNFPRGEAEDGP